MEILFISHCVPGPPEKGEKIRAYFELQYLAAKYRVHLACFARSESEVEWARTLTDRCASVYVELLRSGPGLARAAARFAIGNSLTASFYSSAGMRRHAMSVARQPIVATVAYSSVMAQYAPSGVPLVLDMVDVDSEKWLQYGEIRRVGWLYRREGRRIRRLEQCYAQRADLNLVATRNERSILQQEAPKAIVQYMENGVDLDYFRPLASWSLPELEGRRFVVFVGAMDYYPNADAACRFATRVLPVLRQTDPELEFLIGGRNPSRTVRRCSSIAGVTVTGEVADVRPYLAQSRAVVAPLRIARGIQNKVLEALAMGKPVLASPEVCRTLAYPLPPGVQECASEEEYIRVLADLDVVQVDPAGLRHYVEERFCWQRNVQTLLQAVENCIGGGKKTACASQVY